ncbi:MAG: glycosyltransferase family 2 protein [Alistipes sp.]|nr:glycosyltransferase family 2 protein [Alistipes sp.]
MDSLSISVVIPLYNKRDEVGATLRSVLAQTLPPVEVIVVDDGSTDGGAEVVRTIGGLSVRLISQSNAGVSAARNRGAAQAQGAYVAFLDADDRWEPGFLAEIAAMIREFPGCGIYSTAFWVVGREGRFPAPCPDLRGVVGNFFRDSAHRYISIPSASVVPRHVFDEVGGFPPGMKIGEDLYLWVKIARRWPVCFSPARLVCYSKTAANRSAAIYTPERTDFSFEQLYDPAAPEQEREFIARAALGKALIISAKGGTEEAARAIRTFAFTRIYRRTLRKVRVLNALPVAWRTPVLNFYNRLAWLLAKKGL